MKQQIFASPIGGLTINYYNEFDKKAAAWLRELINEGLIPAGEVDERSIADVTPTDLAGFSQHHFFAGIGGWSYALQLAGWSPDRPVWTGSCPCQPFSSAGKGGGTDDPRHLWPEFRRLIQECKPSVVFGEQVAAKAGRTWLSGVRDDLETLGYGVGAADICAAGINAPHIRQRLWWVGGLRNSSTSGLQGRVGDGSAGEEGSPSGHLSECGSSVGGLCDSTSLRPCGGQSDQTREQSEVLGSGHALDPWGRSVYWPCRDNKWRRVPARLGSNGESEIEPGLFPLADGLPQGVALVRTPKGDKRIMRNVALKGSGNAIVPQVAAQFIGAYNDTLS